MKELFTVIEQLRGKQGCPWDRKQTLKSLRRCLLEETHEVLEAIDERKPKKIEEELGDLLVVVAMMLTIGKEGRRFSKESVLKRVHEKLVRRHPHVFGTERAKNASQARKFWEREKDREAHRRKDESLLVSIGRGYPALIETNKIGKKVSKVGFDWDSVGQVIKKVEEELEEMKQELKTRNRVRIKDELGDFLFTSAQLARFLKIDPEVALLAANRKFRKRFRWMEAKASRSQKNLRKCSQRELEGLWTQAKGKVG